MNRAEATLALIAGKQVERAFCSGRVDQLRWHPVDGLQYFDGGHWQSESGSLGVAEYREVWKPRVFLGVWEEVRTFEEAEPAGSQRESEHQGPMELRTCVFEGTLQSAPVGPMWESKPSFYWVRRKPDAAEEKPDAAYNELYSRCEGLRDALRSQKKLLEKDLVEANLRADEWRGYLEEAAGQLKVKEAKIKELNGLLDEVLPILDRMPHRRGLAESIRARRDGK